MASRLFALGVFSVFFTLTPNPPPPHKKRRQEPQPLAVLCLSRVMRQAYMQDAIRAFSSLSSSAPVGLSACIARQAIGLAML